MYLQLYNFLFIHFWNSRSDYSCLSTAETRSYLLSL